MDRGRIVWGIVLLAVGIVALAGQFGLLPEWLMLSNWAFILGGLTLLFVITYVVSGFEWGLLFPAAILGGVTGAVIFGELGMGSLSGASVMIGVAIPFIVALVQQPRQNWWAVIPGGVMLSVALTILSAPIIGGAAGSVMLWGIAVTFLIVYLFNREFWWALIPAGILFVVGIFPIIGSAAVPGGVIGMAVVGLLSLAFFAVTLLLPAQRWAIIPAVVLLAVAGLIAVDTFASLPGQIDAAVFFGLLALGFFVLWLLREQFATGWALVVAGGLLVVGLLQVLLGESASGIIWAVALLALGGWLVYRTLRPA